MAHRINPLRLRRRFGVFAMAVLLLVVSASLVFGATTNEKMLEPLQMRTNIVVAGPTITFDDLFSNAGVLADLPIAAAPLPGRKLTLSPLGIARIASAHGRQWSNLSGLRRILVKRSGRRLGSAELSELIVQELAYNGIGGQFELAINSGSSGIYVPETGTDIAVIKHVDFNASTGGFKASLLPYLGAEIVMLRGRAWPLTQIPSLNRAFSSGEEITAEDITWISSRADRLGLNPVLQEDELVGKAARRSLRPGIVIRQQDIKTPDAVAKGELITIIYELPGLRLTARGKVLANAGAGESVRVVNLSSNRTIDVTITGPGQAVAVPTQMLGG